MCIVLSSNQIHKDMINSFVYTPMDFFDTTPSGILINKLSNDLGTIDKNLFYSLTEAIEGPISAFIAIINISFINLKFFAPSILSNDFLLLIVSI